MDAMNSQTNVKKSFQISAGQSANALSLSKDNSKVVVAGRSLLKIYSVDEATGFHEHVNMHVGRKQVSYNYMYEILSLMLKILENGKQQC